MFGRVTNQAVNQFDGLGKVIMVADAPATIGQATGFAVFVVHINQVNVARHIQLARAKLSHADDPQHGAFALRRRGHAIARIELLLSFLEGDVQSEFAQLSHGACDRLERRALIAVQHHQALEHQLAQHPQGIPTAVGFAQRFKTGVKGGLDRCARRQQVQVSLIAPSQALHKA